MGERADRLEAELLEVENRNAELVVALRDAKEANRHIGRFEHDAHVEIQHSLADPKWPYRVLVWSWWEPLPKQAKEGVKPGWHDGNGNVFNRPLVADPDSSMAGLKAVDHVKHFRNAKGAVAYRHKILAMVDRIDVHKQRHKALETTWKRVL